MKKFLFFILFFYPLFVFGQFTDNQSAQLIYQNYSKNGGFEQGKKYWAESGSGTFALETTTINSGKVAGKFTSSAASDYLYSTAVAIKQGPNCQASFYYKTTSTAFKAKVYQSSTEVATLDLTANTAFQEAKLSFVCDASLTYQLRIINGAASDIIYVDDVIMSKNFDIGSVNQQDVQYSLTVTGTNFTNGASIGIPYRTKDGTWRLRMNIKGYYTGSPTSGTLTVSGVTFKSDPNSYAESCSMSLMSSGISPQYFQTVQNTSTLIWSTTASYSSPNFIGACDVQLASKPTWATQTADETVVRAETSNQFAGIKWTNSGLYLGTSSSYQKVTHASADTNRTLLGIAQGTGTANEIGLKIPSLNPGKYYVTFSSRITASPNTTQTECLFALTDGTTTLSTFLNSPNTTINDTIGSLSGYFEYSSLGDRTFNVSVKRISGDGNCIIYNAASSDEINQLLVIPLSPQMSMPQIINSVGTEYAGVTKLNSATIGGASRTTKCSSSPCSVYDETGDWINTVTRPSGAGTYVITFNSNIFTQDPVCNVSVGSDVSFVPIWFFGSTPTKTGATVQVYYYSAGYNAQDANFMITCQGPK